MQNKLGVENLEMCGRNARKTGMAEKCCIFFFNCSHSAQIQGVYYGVIGSKEDDDDVFFHSDADGDEPLDAGS